MPAIDESANLVLYVYKDKKWIKKRMSFPAAMNVEGLRNYLGFTDKDADHHYPNAQYPILSIFVQEDEEKKSLKYFIDVDIFVFNGNTIVCEGFVDFIHLMQELKPYVDIAMNDDYLNLSNPRALDPVGQ